MGIANIKDSKMKIDIGVDGQCDSPGNDLKGELRSKIFFLEKCLGTFPFFSRKVFF